MQCIRFVNLFAKGSSVSLKATDSCLFCVCVYVLAQHNNHSIQTHVGLCSHYLRESLTGCLLIPVSTKHITMRHSVYTKWMWLLKWVPFSSDNVKNDLLHFIRDTWRKLEDIRLICWNPDFHSHKAVSVSVSWVMVCVCVIESAQSLRCVL